jgi:5-methylcytosine-specific restriction enzyme A
MNISVKDYKAAIRELSNRHQEILTTLYYLPKSAATASELATALGYKSFQGANRHIGEIGKRLGFHIGVKFPMYYDSRGKRPAYYSVIGPYTEEGWKMWPALRRAMESLNLVSKENTLYTPVERLSTEIEVYNEAQFLKEGKAVQVSVSRYERNFLARKKCLEHHGYQCAGCNMEFGAVYGGWAAGFMHVHHIKPMHELKREYTIDPIDDLIPLCPNCHAVVHLSKPVLTIPELKKLLKKRNAK